MQSSEWYERLASPFSDARPGAALSENRRPRPSGRWITANGGWSQFCSFVNGPTSWTPVPNLCQAPRTQEGWI
jgi:hypothetical protein